MPALETSLILSRMAIYPFINLFSTQTLTPLLRRSASTVSMPCLSMIRIPLLDTRNLTKRFSDSTQNRWVWRFGEKRRRVLLLACETLFPVTGFLPVTIHTLDISEPHFLNYFLN